MRIHPATVAAMRSEAEELQAQNDPDVALRTDSLIGAIEELITSPKKAAGLASAVLVDIAGEKGARRGHVVQLVDALNRSALAEAGVHVQLALAANDDVLPSRSPVADAVLAAICDWCEAKVCP